MAELTYLVIYCRDLEVSTGWYEKLLGVPSVEERHGDGPLHCSFLLGKLVLELYPERAEGHTHVRLGIEVPPHRVNPPSGKKSRVVRDPDGNTIELIQAPDPRERRRQTL